MSREIRINRFLASAGFGSRRKCERLIADRKVTVNGETVTGFATLVDPESDEVMVEGARVVPPERRQVVILNKPPGVLSSVSDDRGRRTVADIAREHGFTRRLYPVGRLDMDTSGLILLTDDGELANRLTHPSYKVEKEYIATVEGLVSDETVERLKQGVELEGFTTGPCHVEVLSRDGGLSRLVVRLTEGKKRQIRRMFLSCGHRVTDLCRVAIGDLRFEDLEEGGIRPLTEDEEESLRERTGLLHRGRSS